MKRPWQRDFDSFIHSVPTWGKLGQKEQFHNFHCSLLTCMLDACDRASHWRHQCDQDTLSVFPECTFYVGRQKDKPPSGMEQGIRGCAECWGHSRGTQELSYKFFSVFLFLIFSRKKSSTYDLYAHYFIFLHIWRIAENSQHFIDSINSG